MTEAIYSEVKKASEDDRHRISVVGVLKYLGVSKSGYYDWLNRDPSRREKRRMDIQKKISNVYEYSHEIYGAPKITQVLNHSGTNVSERTVTRYMHEMGIHAWYRRPYTVTTVSRDFSDNLTNILNREFNPEHPNAIWCTDITYISTEEGFCYLSCIMDFFSRKIIAWELGKTLETCYVVNAINEAIKATGTKPKIIHQDRGVQYTSTEYHSCTEGIIKSYSKKGTPWDNACIESFHSLIKREWLWRYKKIKDYDQARKLVFEYINAFYNTVRIHSHCGYVSPDDFEKQYYAELNTTAKNIA